MNWNRVFGNGGLAFFTALAGTQIAGLGAEGALAAFWTAFVMGGVALFTEWTAECKGKGSSTAKKISGMLLL